MDETNGDDMRAAQKQVVADSGTPRKVVNWATAFLGSILNAQIRRAAHMALLAQTRIAPPTAAERAEFAREQRLRARYGRGWRKRFARYQGGKWHGQGERECARRLRQMQKRMLSPIFNEHPQPYKHAA